jgi:hypothetical protein
MSITRYDIYSQYNQPREEITEIGDWVYYKDHISEVKALQEEIALLKAKLNFDWDGVK